MVTAQEHYDKHLAAFYLWMVGGSEAALARATAEIQAMGLTHGQGRYAIDLGAGFGTHSIPLAQCGYEVLAIDSCSLFLERLNQQRGSLPIRVVQDDLLTFDRYRQRPTDLICCMGDTLTHLPDHASVRQLFSAIAQALACDGRFVATWRNYTKEQELSDDKRFIAVKSDPQRILTCFLEYLSEDRVMVHDLLYEQVNGQWDFKVSSYPKLRLSARRVVQSLTELGLSASVDQMAGGMWRLIAQKSQA